MKSSRYLEGDIISIGFPERGKLLGWIVYVSTTFKNVVGILIYQLQESDIDRVGVIKPLVGPLYTSSVAVRQSKWAVIGHRPVARSILRMTERVVGGSVYLGDTLMRPCAGTDRERLPEMGVMGIPIIIWEIEKAMRTTGTTPTNC
jgi:hypothetical protein